MFSFNYALGLQYSGVNWSGWQTQPSQRTIQDQLQISLSDFLGYPVVVYAAGRTDAGVHALNQVIHFAIELDTPRPDRSWLFGLNSRLPDSIRVRWVRQVSPNFHARFSALERTYCYIIHEGVHHPPFFNRHAAFVNRSLDIAQMQLASLNLLGSHDFSSFRSSECQAKNTIRTLTQISILRSGSIVSITLCADGFLQNMVRNIVSALIFVGQGKRPVSWLLELLRAKDRTQGPATATSDGLYFIGPNYAENWQLPALKNTHLHFFDFLTMPLVPYGEG